MERFSLASLTIRVCASLVCIAFGVSFGQEAPSRGTFFYHDAAAHTVAGEVLDGRTRYDADLATLDEEIWYTWLEFVPGEGDYLSLGVRQNGAWRFKKRLTARAGFFACPTLTVNERGRLWLSYEVYADGSWDVVAAEVSRVDGSLAVGRRVGDGSGTDIRHRVAAARDASLWFVWQQDRGGQFDIALRQVTPEGLGAVHVVSEAPAGDWHPQVASDANGVVYVVWDSYDGESYNVVARSLRGGTWGKIIDVARTSAFEARAQIAVDGHERVWVMWEVGGENYGEFFRGSLTRRAGLPPQTDTHGPVHRFRELRFAILGDDGRVRRLAEGLPMPAKEHLRSRTDVPAAIERTGAYYERGRLVVDGAGRLWALYRHYYSPWLGRPWNGEHRAFCAEGTWKIYARVFGTAGWSELYGFDIEQGDGLQRLEVAPYRDGLAAVWTTGRADRRVEYAARLQVREKYKRYAKDLPPPEKDDGRHHGIVTATLSSGIPAAKQLDPGAVDFTSLDSDPVDSDAGSASAAGSVPVTRLTTVESGGRRRHLVFGDLHRHTDLSLCYSSFDGTIDDAYRYAIDVARLQFLAITDHSRDLALGDHLSLVWWRSAKEVYRHELAGRFYPFFAYERSRGETDHNVISLRHDVLRPHTYLHAEYWRELTADTIMIPHANFVDEVWKYHDDDRRPLVEIYQGFRNIASENVAHAGLAKGYRVGFIGSSDHVSTSAAYAAAWVDALTRESILQALKARRTYGATAPIRLLVRVGDHWMGEAIEAPGSASLTIDAEGTAPIRKVEVIVDGKVHRTLTPGMRSVHLMVDLDLSDWRFAYVRVTQDDGERAWSSPLWLVGK